MKKTDILKIIDEIKKEKKRLIRTLNDDEIAHIMKNKKLKDFDKQRIIITAKSGTNDINFIYRICKSGNIDVLEAEQKEFINISIQRIEKDLNKYANYVSSIDIPSREMIIDYQKSRMKMVFIKKTIGMEIEEYQSFIDNHPELYKEICGEKVNKKK